jgi:hypothetical protein
LVNTRILTTRRQLGTGRHAHHRRRRSTWPFLATVASTSTSQRLGLSSFARVYATVGALLTVVIAYLVLGAHATQTSYELDRLRAQNAQLLAEQDQLRYRDASLHTRAGIAQAAAAAGLQLSNTPKYVGYQPVALDLAAPIGPGRPQDTPLWQQALAAIVGNAARDAQAAGR